MIQPHVKIYFKFHSVSIKKIVMKPILIDELVKTIKQAIG